jgi:hypothetical protein
MRRNIIIHFLSKQRVVKNVNITSSNTLHQTDRTVECIIKRNMLRIKDNAYTSLNFIHDVNKLNDVRKITSTLNVVQHIFINSLFVSAC